MRLRRALGPLLAAATLASCAPEVVRVPIAPLSASAAHPDTIVLEREVLVRIGTGFDRVLSVGTRWRFAGVISQGSAYRAAQGVFTLEGANIHEAYLVLRGAVLVGFYLPVEQAFSPLPDSVTLAIRKN